MPNGVCSKLRGHIGSHQNLWDKVRTANGIVSSSLEALEKTVIALQAQCSSVKLLQKCSFWKSNLKKLLGAQ